MTDQHPITPPQWQVDAWYKQAMAMGADVYAILLEAARWGADQELEACISAVLSHPGFEQPELFIELLRAARRPEPPSLKLRIAEAIAKGNKRDALSLLDEALDD